MQKLLGKLYDKIAQETDVNSVTEIRIRVHRPILVKTFFREFFLDFIPDNNLINCIVDVATSFSRYAYENEISDGFLEYGNAIRIGMCGTGKINDKKLIAYSSVTSVCIRIPHSIPINEEILKISDGFVNTLIIGPPYSGKTTLIRAITSVLAKKNDVVVIDERGEICGKNAGLLCSDRLDIVGGIPKEKVFGNIIRSMSPDVIVCDELFSDADLDAVRKINRSGVKCLASFHSNEIRKVPEELKKEFECFVTLTSKPHSGRITSIVRKNG